MSIPDTGWLVMSRDGEFVRYATDDATFRDLFRDAGPALLLCVDLAENARLAAEVMEKRAS